MAIDVDWAGDDANPYRIFIPRADMPVVQASPEIRELDTNAFRLALKDLESSEEGILYPDTHSHSTETVLSGLAFARQIKILPPYMIEFEDGQYTVRATGSNHNISDVKFANQVSLTTQNSAGLINATLTAPEVASAILDALASSYAAAGTIGELLNLLSRRMALQQGIDVVVDEAAETIALDGVVIQRVKVGSVVTYSRIA